MTTNAQATWNYLLSQGYSPGAAAGIMGNLAQESSLNPNAPGGGVAQWTGSRLTGLDQYAAQSHQNATDLNTQLGYLNTELQSGQYANVKRLNAMTPTQAALYISQNYEKPGTPMNQNRINYANEYYQQFTGGASPNAPQGSNAIPTTPSITKPSGVTGYISRGFWGLMGIVLVGLGIWIMLNPFADLSSAILEAAKTVGKNNAGRPFEGATATVRNQAKKSDFSRRQRDVKRMRQRRRA